MEAGRDPRLFLRSLDERRFLPITHVRLMFPDGVIREHSIVILNRLHVELLEVCPQASRTAHPLEVQDALAETEAAAV
jgi:hypothetical protein